MRPAFSVLFLTTLIGIGQGLLVALVAGQWYFVIGSGPAREGDSFYFESRRPHSWRNSHDGETVIIWINTPPTF